MSVYQSRLQLNEPDKKEYIFLSRGVKGTFRKVVELERYPETNIFNVLLVDETVGRRGDDETLTGNHDALKVINTVVRVIEKFLIAFPGNAVFISGNTPAKKALTSESFTVCAKPNTPCLPIVRKGESLNRWNAPLILVRCTMPSWCCGHKS